jgi:hypothetical protein
VKGRGQSIRDCFLAKQKRMSKKRDPNTDENPKDTVSIKYATVQDAKDTIRKVININKPYARKIQILTVLEQRAKVAGKFEQARLAKAAKLKLKRMHDGTSKKSKKS